MTPEPVVREQAPNTPNMAGAGRWQPGSDAPPGLTRVVSGCDCGGRPPEIGGAEHRVGCPEQPALGWVAVDKGGNVFGLGDDGGVGAFKDARDAAPVSDDETTCALVPADEYDRLRAASEALADVVKVIDTDRHSDDESAKFGADLLAAIIRDALRKHGLYPEVER